jgi:hypothetical protein
MKKHKKTKKLEEAIVDNLKKAFSGYIGELAGVELGLRKLQDQLLNNMTSIIPPTSNIDVEQDKDDPKKINVKFTFNAELVEISEPITIKYNTPIKEALTTHFKLLKNQPVVFKLVCPECKETSILGDCSSLETVTRCKRCQFQWLFLEA